MPSAKLVHDALKRVHNTMPRLETLFDAKEDSGHQAAAPCLQFPFASNDVASPGIILWRAESASIQVQGAGVVVGGRKGDQVTTILSLVHCMLYCRPVCGRLLSKDHHKLATQGLVNQTCWHEA